MNLIKTSFFAGIAVAIQVVSGFIISKVVAVYIGPSGLALIGQFQSFSQIVQSFAGGAVGQGVVKFIAEFRDNLSEKKKILSTSFIVSLLCSLIIAVFLFSFHNFLSLRLLKDQSYFSIFIIFGFTIVFFSLNTFLLSILNGEGDIKKYTLVNIVSSLSNLFLIAILLIYHQVFGALLALVLNQSIVFFVTLSLVIKSSWFRWQYFFGGIDKDYAVKLFKYFLMFIATACTVPVSQILVRNYIGSNLSWNDAGYWQAVTKISDAYLMLITTTLSVYYLPKLSRIGGKVLKREILYGYKIILPAVSFLALSIFLCKNIIVNILFSEDFLPVLNLFKFQLLGDVLKIGAWLLAYIMIAKAMTRIFIITEVIFSLSYVVFAIVGINLFGLKGATIAFAVNYLIYWLFMIIIIKRKLHFNVI